MVDEKLVLANIYGLVRPASGTDYVLLQRRWKPKTDPNNLGKFELPGGKWRAFESAAEALTREVQEETRVVVSAIECVRRLEREDATVDIFVPLMIAQMVSGPYPSVLVVLEARGEGMPASRGDGSRDAAWKPVDEVRQMLVEDATAITPLSAAILSEYLQVDRATEGGQKK